MFSTTYITIALYNIGAYDALVACPRFTHFPDIYDLPCINWTTTDDVRDCVLESRSNQEHASRDGTPIMAIPI